MTEIEEHAADDLNAIIGEARSAIDQEFAISERLDSKARGQVTLAGQWFAVVQAVSAVAYSASHPRHWLLYCVAGTALAGGLVLAVLFGFSAAVWRTRKEPALSPRALAEMKAIAADPDRNLLPALVDHYASILRDRRVTNRTRVDALTKSEWFWYVAMTVPLSELGFALATRLFV
jgi:hypothetical protein